jgi:hypothetical protein
MGLGVRLDLLLPYSPSEVLAHLPGPLLTDQDNRGPFGDPENTLRCRRLAPVPTDRFRKLATIRFVFVVPGAILS